MKSRILGFTSLALFSFQLVGCLEPAKPDIIWIGNGADAATAKNSKQVVVLDVKEKMGLQSFVVENKDLHRIDEKLELPKETEPLPLGVEAEITQATHLDWIARLENGKTLFQVTIEKEIARGGFDHPSHDEPFTAAIEDGFVTKETSKTAEKKLFAESTTGAAREVALKNFQFAADKEPLFFKDGSFAFLDAHNNLKISFDRKASKFLEKEVTEFVLDASGAVFFLTQEGWNYFSKSDLKAVSNDQSVQPRKFVQNDIFYMTEDGTPMVYFTHASNENSYLANQLYEFNSATGEFSSVWKQSPEIQILRAHTFKDRSFAIQGKEYIFVAELQDRLLLVALGPNGIVPLPISEVLAASQIQFGDKNVLVSQKKEDGHLDFQICSKQVSGYVCGKPQELENLNVSKAVLGEGDLLYTTTKDALLIFALALETKTQKISHHLAREISVENLAELRFLKTH